MRLRHVFGEAGLPPAAIEAHLQRLEPKRTQLERPEERQRPVEVSSFKSKNGNVVIRVLYGDITSRSFMSSEEFQDLRRAVISPDDTFVTAGGGVAETLLLKAGRQFVLNELAKFSPIGQGTVAVTSGGNLPVHYLFHAAAIKVEHDASYTVSKDSVYQATLAAFEKAEALEIGALWLPLMGTGLAGLEPKESLAGMLEAIRDWEAKFGGTMTIMIFIYKFTTIDKVLVDAAVRATLAHRFDAR
jgi:O-acetyl-ADP-ribose deacetylase (regulator of RNase III)